MNLESDFKNHKITFGEEILAGSVGYHNLPLLKIPLPWPEICGRKSLYSRFKVFYFSHLPSGYF